MINACSEKTKTNYAHKDNVVRLIRNISRQIRPTTFDNCFGLSEYLSVWFFLIGLFVAASEINSVIFDCFVGIIIGGRFRALEEIAHFTMHNVIFSSRWAGVIISDNLSQYPLFNPSTSFWTKFHCAEHHPNVGKLGSDPAFQLLLDAGMARGMSKWQFAMLVLMPLSPRGIVSRIKFALLNICAPGEDKVKFVARLVNIVCLCCLIVILFGWKVFILAYLPALILWLPLFSWISLICEHSWFAIDRLGSDEGTERELAFGKRTKFEGLAGAIARALIFPVGDTYHLAHSLVPSLHFRFLSWFDRMLIASDAGYKHVPQTHGLFGSRSRPGSLLYIYHQVTET